MLSFRIMFCALIMSLLFVCAAGCDSDEENTSGLPQSLPVSFERQDTTPAVSPDERRALTEELLSFYRDTDHFNWLLRMSHGVDASTGKKEFLQWWTEAIATRQGDTLVMRHKDYPDGHGAHNILKDNTTILISAIGGHLLTGDATSGELARLYCLGISATMLGMVHDENDPLKHLMGRSMVPFNHGYDTHDGHHKEVEYDSWFFPYDRWNCSRFEYADNPYWGPVWVTNTRSKDGLGYLFNADVAIRYAAEESPDAGVREACGETHELLTLFAKDIVDHEYVIRSKDAQGQPYRPGIDPDPEEARIKDISSFTYWDPLFPDAECIDKLAADLLGYGKPMGTVCEPFGGNEMYEVQSIRNNPPNVHIMRSFHIAAIRQALLNGYHDEALASLSGLEQRFERDMTFDLEMINKSRDAWERDIAFNLLQAAGTGYYLTGDEARLVMTYLKRSIEQFRKWESWNLWADDLPQGEEIPWLPPNSGVNEQDERQYWLRIGAMGLALEYCWSPFTNHAGAAPVDCELLKSQFGAQQR